jgi:hypothetical protein
MSKATVKSHKHKGSQHADVIDRLDYSAVGPNSSFTFHHDGPFDACAPSRNRHRTKAPILAWSDGDPADEAALASAKKNVVSTVDTSPRDPPPIPPYYYKEPSKKKVDALAEAWGMHEPEPFEEFFAGNGDTPDSSIYAGKEGQYGHHTRASGGPTPQRKELREVHRYYIENESDQEDDVGDLPRSPHRRPLPPPQPIFHGSGELGNEVQPPTETSPGPKRSKSILTRFRNFRDSNVPSEYPPSPTLNEQAQPAHKLQPSFLGRFRKEPTTSPTENSFKEPAAASPTENSFNAPTEQFVYVENVGRSRPGVPFKELPATPLGSGGSPTGDQQGYFDDIGLSSPGATGLGRTASKLKRKVGQVVGRKHN